MKLHFISGLPRSGSTLLTSLLYQNPDLHTEGVSGLCDLMWSAQRSLDNQATYANHRREHADRLISHLPALHYSHITRPVVIDKCRAWTLPLNVQMIERYITPQPKIICCVRDVPDIIASFERLFSLNHTDTDDRLPFMSELDVSLVGLDAALQTGDHSRYLIVSYDRLIDHTAAVFDEIYDFIELPRYVHDLSHIVNKTPEDDAVYGLSGMHDVRPQIARRDASL